MSTRRIMAVQVTPEERRTALRRAPEATRHLHGSVSAVRLEEKQGWRSRDAEAGRLGRGRTAVCQLELLRRVIRVLVQGRKDAGMPRSGAAHGGVTKKDTMSGFGSFCSLAKMEMQKQ